MKFGKTAHNMRHPGEYKLKTNDGPIRILAYNTNRACSRTWQRMAIMGNGSVLFVVLSIRHPDQIMGNDGQKIMQNENDAMAMKRQCKMMPLSMTKMMPLSMTITMNKLMTHFLVRLLYKAAADWLYSMSRE